MKSKKSKKTTSADRLRNFLNDEYIKKGGADNMFVAIRDCLTDMHYVWNDVPIKQKGNHSILSRAIDAQEVYHVEKDGKFA